MIRREPFSTSERIIALVIGVSLFGVSLFGFVVGIQQKHFRMMLAAVGGVCVAAIFLIAGAVGRPMS